MRDKIDAYVRDKMKSYGVSDAKLASELAEACRDEYKMQKDGGAEEEKAFGAAVCSVDGIIRNMVKPRNKYGFALGVGILALCVSVMEMLCSLLSRAVYFYNAEMIVAAAGFIIITVVYVAVARRNCRWFNFLFLGVIIISWLVTFFLLLPAFFFNYTPGSYQNLQLIFPCLFKISVHRDWMAAGEAIESYVFYSNFIVSLGVFISALVLYFKQKSALKTILS